MGASGGGSGGAGARRDACTRRAAGSAARAARGVQAAAAPGGQRRAAAAHGFGQATAPRGARATGRRQGGHLTAERAALTPLERAGKNCSTRPRPSAGGASIPAHLGHSYLDLHAHSTDASDDAGGTVEGYLKWIVARRRKGYRIDGFVLTEHRQFDPGLDYGTLAAQYGVTVLRGAEVETDAGHVLVYGIDARFTRAFDLADVALPYAEVFRAAREFGGFAVGAHAGRPRIGIAEHVAQRGISLEHVEALEQLNGGSSVAENARAAALASAHGLGGIGGSDAHFVNAIGRCLTAFRRPVTSIEALVEELRAGEYHALRVEETLPQAVHAGESGNAW
ncbi:MAG: hypothetical protein EXR65_01145 [Dehalococcoidia bacterium]|nr:hypothetical protein [Dehalococcoidia bacterium]